MLFSCLLLAMLFSPAVGPLFYPLWVRSVSFFSSGSSICSRSWLHLELCSLPGVAVLRASVSLRERRTHRLLQCGALVCQGLAVIMALHKPLAIVMALHGFQRRCPRADPRVLFRTLLHVLRVWRALTSGWS